MLIIFDCDGVLVDSEKLAAQVFSDCLEGVGIRFGAEQCFARFKGHTLDYCVQWLQQQFGASSLPPDFLQTLNEQTTKRFASDLRPVEGVEKILRDLQQRQRAFCVASNGGREKVAHSLRVTGLFGYFAEPGRRFSRDDVKKGKPAPDLFLFAAQQMHIAPAETIVIEDSLTGVQAALAAGMRVYFYAPDTRVRLPEFDTDRVVPLRAMVDLEPLFK
jgi:HAD superfamily hydrolase (TIGR01509 family)